MSLSHTPQRGTWGVPKRSGRRRWRVVGEGGSNLQTSSPGHLVWSLERACVGSCCSAVNSHTADNVGGKANRLLGAEKTFLRMKRCWWPKNGVFFHCLGRETSPVFQVPISFARNTKDIDFQHPDPNTVKHCLTALRSTSPGDFVPVQPLQHRHKPGRRHHQQPRNTVDVKCARPL